MQARVVLALLSLLVAEAARAGEPLTEPTRPDLSRAQPVTAFRPTQVSLGRGLVRYLEQKWQRQAKRRGEPLADRLKAKAARIKVPVVVAPSGDVMALDRHHHITALRELAEREGIELALPIKVVKNYQGYSQAEFAEHFVNNLKMGYFPPEMRDLSAIEKMQLLPTTFDQMKNDPVRSAVGIAFRKLGIQYLRMKNYAELQIGDLAVERGLKERALAFPASSDPTRQPLVRATRDLILNDRVVRHAVKHLGLKHRDRRKIAKKLRKAS